MACICVLAVHARLCSVVAFEKGGTLVVEETKRLAQRPYQFTSVRIRLTLVLWRAMEVADVRGRKLTVGTSTATRDRVQEASTKQMERGRA